MICHLLLIILCFTNIKSEETLPKIDGIYDQLSTDIASNTFETNIKWNDVYEEIETFLTDSLEELRTTYGEDHVNLVHNLQSLGILLTLKDEFDTALEYVEKAHEILKATHGDDSMDISLGESFYNIGFVWRRKCEWMHLKKQKPSYNKVLKSCVQALRIYEKNYGKSDLRLSRILLMLGQTQMSKREHPKAIKPYERVLEMQLEEYGENNKKVADTLYHLATAYKKKGERERAEGLITKYKESQAKSSEYYKRSDAVKTFLKEQEKEQEEPEL